MVWCFVLFFVILLCHVCGGCYCSDEVFESTMQTRFMDFLDSYIQNLQLGEHEMARRHIIFDHRMSLHDKMRSELDPLLKRLYEIEWRFIDKYKGKSIKALQDYLEFASQIPWQHVKEDIEG